MKSIVIDTCCLINLYASGRFAELISSNMDQAVIPAKVFDESLYIRQPSSDDPEVLENEAIELQVIKKLPNVIITDLLGSEELEKFIDLTSLIDDGESACIAIAYCRELCIASDDRKAQKVAQEHNISCTSTPKIIKTWSSTKNITKPDILQVIHNIERFANYSPHHTSEYYAWWNHLKNK
jgi:predicted nucleic acid-binding protein